MRCLPPQSRNHKAGTRWSFLQTPPGFSRRKRAWSAGFVMVFSGRSLNLDFALEFESDDARKVRPAPAYLCPISSSNSYFLPTMSPGPSALRAATSSPITYKETRPVDNGLTHRRDRHFRRGDKSARPPPYVPTIPFKFWLIHNLIWSDGVSCIGTTNMY